MNAAARLVCSARKYEHITPLLRDLHWLRVPERIEFKLSVLVFRCLRTWTVDTRKRLRFSSTFALVTRDRPKFGFGAETETDLKCSFGSVSVTVPSPHFTFGFSRNYSSRQKLEWVKLMEDLRHWIGLHTLHREEKFLVKTIMLLGWTLWHDHYVIHAE